MINSVRNTVLSVLNKNNYGYISPSDFNLYAKQAQMERFDEYFSNMNKVVTMENTRVSGTSYADMGKKQQEDMEVFYTSSHLYHNSLNRYFLPSLTTTNDEAMMIDRVLCYTTQIGYGASTNVVTNELENNAATFISDGISEGDIVVNTTTYGVAEVASVLSETNLLLTADIFQDTGDNYIILLGTSLIDVEKVLQTNINMLNNSNLTKPTLNFPAYVQQDGILTVYPNIIRSPGQIVAKYFRYPKAPKWTYITIGNGEPVFDQTQPDYQDFELPIEDEYKLAVKILQYCGVSIREAEVVQYAMSQEQHEEPTFSQKQ